ncbi:phosphonate C-P lyase system protein PhnH [Desulfovibrio cuneatus]|uniref:phosphonate C-P lyase system protein PhnH n=1 Tax=Desulfovibrio cuneatus TaxID=159728 RepID=UPI0004173C24|nr:phosphonate C-P lyase system protein PhnH [Desulfovibrio cuneatus]
MSTLVPGFASPVHEAQQCFHTVLHAMSTPCTLHTLPVLPPQPEAEGKFSAGMAALALALCDGETPLWLQPELDTEPLRRYLRFHCGAVFAPSPENAAFAFIAMPQTMPSLNAFCQGTAMYPETSTTVIIATSFAGASGLVVQGPGIGGAHGKQRPVPVAELPELFWQQWRENNRSFPLGVDVVFIENTTNTAMPRIMGLPRTTVVQAATVTQEAMPCM